VSQENVRVVRQALDAYGRRDVDELRRLNSPELELDWTASKGWLAGLYCGIEEALRFYYEYYEVFESSRVEAESYTPVGDSVVVPNVVYQRGRDGIEVTARSTLVFSMRDGRITHICLYQDTSEALKAMRLEE